VLLAANAVLTDVDNADLTSLTVTITNLFNGDAETLAANVTGTGITGSVRADATGLPLFPATPGDGFNISAFAAPAAGLWGDAGRNTIPGPIVFSLNGSLSRVFRIGERRSIDLRFDATNALNHPTITGWGTTINNSTFGLPTAASAMRKLTANLRFRF